VRGLVRALGVVARVPRIVSLIVTTRTFAQKIPSAALGILKIRLLIVPRFC